MLELSAARRWGRAPACCGLGMGLLGSCVQACGQLYVWFPPSTWQMGHQFIVRAWPVNAREYSADGPVPNVVYRCSLPVFHVIEEP